MKPRFAIGALLFLAGIMLGASAFIASSGTRQSAARSRVGEILAVDGDVSVESNGQSSDAELSQVLKAGDQLVTGLGSVTFRFTNGAEGRLEEHGRLVFEKAAAQVRLVLENGSLSAIKLGDVEKSSEAIRVMARGREFAFGDDAVSRGEPRLNLGADPRAAEAAAGAFESPQSTSANDAQHEATSTQDPASSLGKSASLPNDEIARALAAQAGFFRRCAISYVERMRRREIASAETASSTAHEDFSPRVLMSFTVAPNGHAVDVKSEDVKSGDDRAADELLRRCLTDVISRAPFRPFDGPAIAIVDYPVEIR